MHRLFCTKGHVSPEIMNTWAAFAAREFYDGTIEFDSPIAPDFSIDKAVSYPVALTKLSSTAHISYRRTQQDIRKKNVGFRVIWFIRRGSLRIIRSQGVCDVNQGNAAIVDTGAPFHNKTMPDSQGVHESYQLMIPADLFVRHLQEADKLGSSFSVDTPEGHVVLRLLDLLVGSGESMSRQSALPFSESLLEAIADCMGYRNDSLPRRQRLVDKRLSDIENYILMNLADPDLCYDRVAASCGISPRYLCYVLKANDTSFSELLWKNRLPKARDLLVSPATKDYPIHEIAFMSGFKSAAHFSRMFKATYGCPPREFRAAGGHSTPGDIFEIGGDLHIPQFEAA